jgi:hypothetical protein
MKVAANLLKLFVRVPRAHTAASAPLLLALEPRIVYDASAAAVGAAAGAAQPHPAADTHAAAAPNETAVHRAAGAVEAGTAAGNASGQQRPQAAPHGFTDANAASAAEKQVVFVDPNVTNYQTLIAGLPAGTAVIMLNANTDGLEQIAQYVQQHPGIGAIHLISHGAEGTVQAGATWLDAANLPKYDAELAQIGAAMAPGGDFLIYGCDVAEGSDGRTLVQGIASATHLNVAASTDATGAAALGGDWTLEYQVGNVHTPVIFSAAAEQQYGYLLAQTVEDFTSAAALALNTPDVTTFSLDGITYTYNVANSTTVSPDPSLQSPLGDAEALAVNNDGVLGLTTMTISMTDGKAFKMSSLDIDIVSNTNIFIEANGSTTNDIPIASNGTFVTERVNLSANSAFNDVTSITIAFDNNSIVNLGHLVYQEITPPSVTTTGAATAFTAADSRNATPVAVDSGATIADTESGTISSAAVAITGNFHTGQDVLSFTNTSATTFGSISGSYSAATGVLTLSGTATTAQYQAALDAVTFLDLSGTPNTSARTISFSVNDGLASSNAATKTLTVASPPIVTPTGGTTNYVGGTSAATVDGGVTVSDPSQGTQASGTVSIGGGFHSGDTLAFSNTSATLFGNISSSYNATTGVLTLSSTGSTGTDAQWTNALDAVTFSSSSTSFGNRTVSFAVNDGAVNSAAATKTVDLLNPDPVVTTDSGSAAFVAGDNTASTPVAIDSGLTVTDPGTSTVSSATVAITSNFVSSQDVLAFTNDGSTMGNITGAYNASTGVLTLTAAGGASLAQWNAALDSVTYTDTAITPNNATRTLSFSVTDSNSNTSNTATRTVTVADTDQTPIVTTTGGTVNYTGGSGLARIDSGFITVSDRDNTTQASATVSITSGFVSGDMLIVAGLPGNITGSYNSTTGVLTLTSAGATATDADWSLALSSVIFSAGSSTTPGNRTISFATNDGTKTSVAATDTVDVFAPPQVTTDSGSAAFVAGDNTASTPVAIDSGVTMTDASAASLSSATVAITGNFHSGEDALAFANTSATTFGNIGGSYNATTGVLTLRSSGGAATLAQWQAALDSVTYTDTAITPNNATRTLSFTVTDSNSNTSNTATRTVTVADTDQTPIVTTTGGTRTYVGGGSPVTIDSGITVSDRDNTTQASATMTISSGFRSGDTLNFVNTGNITGSYNASTGVLTLTSFTSPTDAQWAAAMASVTFSAGSSATPGNRTISFVTNDGTKNSAAATDIVDVVAPPQVTTDSGSAAFVAGDNTASTPVAIDSGLTVTDGAAASLSSATVAITGNFASGEDVLAFTNTSATTFGDISGSYNAATGVLRLTSGGAASLAQWQAALDSVTYTDTAITPNAATRTVSFTVTDSGSNTSNTATRTVTVADTDQTPIVTTTGSTTNYGGAASPVTIDSGITVSDRDNTTQASATITIGTGFHSGDTLAYTNTSATTFGNITGSYNSATGVLTLTSSGAIATDAQWAAALSSVTFSTGSGATPGNRTISFVTNDGTVNSAAATDTVNVLGPPQVTTGSGSASFVAGDNTASTRVAIDPNVTVTDPSATLLTATTVAIGGNFVSGEDVLAFTNNGLTMGDITGSYNATTGVLRLTSSSGASIAQWDAALQSITYTDTAITPNNATRTVSFAVTDFNGNTSGLATRTVTVTDTDQTPIVTTTGSTTNYVGGASPRTIDSGITVSDRDNTTQASATITIGTGFHSGDTLAYTNTSATTFGNITGSYNSTTGVLTLTSSGAIATDAQWAAALSSVTFSAGASAKPGNRTISFVTNDGTVNSAAATDTVNVLGPPQVTTDSGSAAFVAGDNTASTPVAIDLGLTVTDGAAASLSSATVAITGSFHSGEDALAFANTSATTFGNIGGSYNATTGVLTLTSSGGSASLEQWQAALDSVTYTDAAITPNNATRTVSFTVTDSTSNTSNTATRTVTVADTDQTPIVTTTGSTTNYASNAGATTIDGHVTVSDRDNTTQSSATISIGSGFHSGDLLAFTNTGPTTFGNITGSYNSTTGVLTLTSAGATATDAQWASALSAITFSTSSTSFGNRTISFATNDGTTTSVAATDTVTVTNPVTLTTDSGSAAFAAGDNTASTPVAIDSGLTVGDISSGRLSSATVAITNGFVSGEDRLVFSNDGLTMGDITGSYNATTGVLTLSSSASATTIANWRSALDAILYTDTAVTPSNTTRTVSFTVTDDNGVASTTQMRTVTVADTDQTPLAAAGGGTVTFTAQANGATPVAVYPSVTLSDLDNTTLAFAQVRITANFDASHDVLSFNASTATMGNINGTYDAATGLLTLTSANASASLAQWSAALESVTYAQTGPATAGTRTISFTVSDGTKSSALVSNAVNVVVPASTSTTASTPPVTASPTLAPPPDSFTHTVQHAPPPVEQPGDADSNPPYVLDAFDQAPPIGTPPVVPTMTFTEHGAAGAPRSLDRASVPALDSLVPSGTTDVTVSTDDRTLADMTVDTLPGTFFSVNLATVLPAVDGATMGPDVVVRLADGGPLPAWLHYDAADGTLRGALPPGEHDVRLLVQERDASGHVTRRELVLTPREQRAPHHAPHLVPHAARGSAAPSTERTAGLAPMPAGKPSLAQQFAQARAALHVQRPIAAAALPADRV